MLRRLLSIGQTSEKNNKVESNSHLRTTGKAIAKKIATVALAFSAQYGALIGTDKAHAQEVQSTSSQISHSRAHDTEHNSIHEIEASELGTLDEVDRDFYQVDPVHSVENGLAILHGSPVIMNPFLDTTDSNKDHFHMYEGYGALGAEYEDKVEGLSKLFSFITPDKVIQYYDAVSFIDTVNWMESELKMTSTQKIRLYYGMIYFWSAMSKWKWEKTDDGKKKEMDVSKMDQENPKVKKYMDILNTNNQDAEITKYTSLLNEVLDQPEYKGKKKYERMREEAKMMKLIDLTNNFANLAAYKNSIREDLVNFIQREGYLDYLDSGLTLFEETMNAFEAGDPDVTRDFLGVQRRLIHTVFVADRRFAKAFDALPPMKMMEKSFHETLVSIKQSTENRILKLLTRYNELMEKPHEFTNKQDYSQTLCYADTVLEYAEAVAKHDSIFAEPAGHKYDHSLASLQGGGVRQTPSEEIVVPARELENFVTKVTTTTKAIKEKYPSLQEILRPDSLVDEVYAVADRVNESLPRYKAISDGEMAAERLTRFLAKTEGDRGTLTPGEKLELLDIFQAVQDSPMREKAEQRLVKALNQAVYLEQDWDKTNIRVERAEDTGFTYDFKNNPVYLETNGVTELTTVQPADKLYAQYTFVNKYRFDLPVQIQIYYPNTRIVMQNVDVVLRANSETEVNYTAVLAAIPSVRGSGSDKRLPDYQMQLASAKIPQMLATDPEVKTMLASRTTSTEGSATYVASTPQTVVGYGAAMPETPNAPLNITTGVVQDDK